MKVGIRKISIEKSIKSRTTGRINRSIKRSVNPLYGKKGIGVITNPEKALYNKVYNKTSVDARPNITINKESFIKNDDTILDEEYVQKQTTKTASLREFTTDEIRKIRNQYLKNVPFTILTFVIVVFISVLNDIMFLFALGFSISVTYMCYCIIQSIKYTNKLNKQKITLH